MQANRANFRVITGGAADCEGVDAHQAPRSEMDEDVALVRRVVAGDVTAAATFHDRIRPIVERTISRLLGTRDPDFDDLVQQGLIELVTSIGSFRGDCPLDAWLSLVSARVAYRHLRRRKLERRLFVVEGSENTDSLDRAAVSPVGARALVRRVQGLLDSMDAMKSWTFVLHDVHGYDLNEIAQITGASVSAAQSRLVRGRRELHEKISKDPDLAQYLNEFRLTAEVRHV